MKIAIFIFFLLKIHSIIGFLSFPFNAYSVLDMFIKAIKPDDKIEENVMKYAVPGTLCRRQCQKNDTRVCYFKFQINYYQVMSG